MSYQHRFVDHPESTLPSGKVVCIGRNYADHARELNNLVPEEPLLFIKPSTALVPLEAPLTLPSFGGDCHFEGELAVLIGQPLCRADAAQTLAAVAGYGLALDLTLRELQNELKTKGHPWEKAKAFDGSCPISPFVAAGAITDVEDCQFSLWLNNEQRQFGETRNMLTPVSQLLAYCSRFFTLLPGDIVLTGTPAGVGVLTPGDHLKLTLADQLSVETTVG